MNFPLLFSPLQVGPYRLNHRIVMAPLTRMRAEKESFPTSDPSSVVAVLPEVTVSVSKRSYQLLLPVSGIQVVTLLACLKSLKVDFRKL